MQGPRVFISYSSFDRPSVETMAKSLRNVDIDTWIDQELHGGGTWWSQILDQIEQSDVLVYALSQHSRRSKACRAERVYARALGIPVLIVRLDDVELTRTPEALEQIFDYDPQSVDSFITLLNEVKRLSARPRTPVEPRPERPPVPGAYIHDFVVQLEADELSWTQQTRLLEDIKLSLKKEHDPRTRDDLMDLLRRLSNRPDVVKDVDAAIGDYLAQTVSADPRKPDPIPVVAQPSPSPRPMADAPAPAQPQVNPAQPGTPHPPGTSTLQFAGAAIVAPTPVPASSPASIVAFVLAAVGIFSFGLPAWVGVVAAGIGLGRKERLAKAAMWTSLGVAIIGLIIFIALAASGDYYSY
ncbi:TIR protein [Xylanimonas cellulosilytica DSM 15894]|uniref:TIR protein n=1 Tax=Xylanimonas cellulosilytica (strain DSM 15894 / JCM 12276 / CECT 5975 / KCTC 9989 / LMG 20990 / NBRC 107835 / XIL07) TaxID=446471 RepID=D1BX99_XYLCX|nr:toll/interleukin-1 receptor domain-containing protein [Xylanimonas cellulosilytica]ACZ31667.1 TIR protein [Xylanimonas cellulosilytica DSM 15894]